MTGGTPLQGRRDQLVAAVSAVDGLGSELWRASGVELETIMGEADQLVAAGEAARVLVLAEAMGRGETGAGVLALTPVQWVRVHAPSTRGGGAAQVVAVAKAFSVPGRGAVKDAVLSGSLPVSSAAVVVSEADKLAPLLADGVEASVVDGLIEMAVGHGPRGCRMVRPRLLAQYGRDGELQREQDVAKRFVALSQPRIDEMGLAEYRMTLDPEGRAVLEAALGPLSAPCPVQGEPDLRSSDRRRGEALVMLVRRAVERGDKGPRHTKSQLFVTVDLETLQQGLQGAGAAMGGVEAGTLLAPETVRRLACDATIIPTVLGGDGSVVDLGRDVRLFTAAQVKRLWLRDRHCTYPGCDLPAQWTDAHHLIHWADGGPTDLRNSALICERHHTVVHQRRYAGVVATGDVGDRVEWDLTMGSYDRMLAAATAREPA